MNEDQKSFIQDLLKSEGWKLAKALNKKQVDEYRIMATQQNCKLEDRLWYSALALGREELEEELTRVAEKTKK